MNGIVLNGSPLALFIQNTVFYARLSQEGADPNRLIFGSLKPFVWNLELLSAVLERNGHTPNSLVEIGFVCSDYKEPAWGNLNMGPDREKCVRGLAKLLGCKLRYWQKYSLFSLPPYVFVGEY